MKPSVETATAPGADEFQFRVELEYTNPTGGLVGASEDFYFARNLAPPPM